MADLSSRRRRETASSPSFYWYDTETTGTDPRCDRIIQFASQRTDEDLVCIEEPFTQVLKIPDEVLMNPEALLITGLSPDYLETNGTEEWKVFQSIRSQLSRPRTCIAGFNNISFDNEFLRYGMYRNLMPPYEHEWKRNNSYFDLINVVRLTCALRPEGIEWPLIDGVPTFTLGAIAESNKLDIADAHDALVDVNLTIEISRLIKRAQPRLWKFACDLRSRDQVDKQLFPLLRKPVLHVSNHYSNARYCIAPVLPVVVHPQIKNQVIAIDLMSDLSLILQGSADQIRETLFMKRSDLDDQEARPGIHTIAINKVPTIAPMSTLPRDAQTRLNIDFEKVQQAVEQLTRTLNLDKKIRQIYEKEREFEPAACAEEALYDGFIPDRDASTCEKFWDHVHTKGTWMDVRFEDQRLNDLASRLKARLFPDKLSDLEKTNYLTFVRDKLNDENRGLTCVKDQIQSIRSKTNDVSHYSLLNELETYIDKLAQTYES